MADKIINVNDDNVKGEGSGFKKGGEDTVTGNITGSIELRPLKLVAPGTASKDESEDLSDVLKDKYNNISELVDTVLELVKNNGALIKRLTLEFGDQEAAKKKVTPTRKKPTSKKTSTAPPKKRGRPKKAAPAPVYDIGRGEIQGTEDKVEAIGTVSSPEQGVSSFIESPLFFTDIDRGRLARDKEESDKSNWALVNRDPTAFFEDLDVNWFEILLKTINNISDRLDEQTSLLNDKLFTLGDIRELVKGILTDSDRLRDLDREATEPPEMPSEASDRDEKDKDRERGLRSGRGGRSGGWLDQRLYEMTGMLVNFAGLGELDDLLGITDLVWDNAGKVWGKIKDKFKKKDKKGPETLDVDILDPEFKAEDVSPRPAIEDRVIDVESVTDDVKDRITRDQLLLPPVTWEFPEQRAGSHPVSPLGGGSGDIIDVEPLSDEDLTLLPPPPESLELVLSDEAKEYLDTIKDAKGIEGGEPVSEGLTKDDLLEALNSQKTTSSVASLSEYTHGKLVTSKDETGGLGKDGINDLKKLLKQMAGEGSMMSMASMLMLAKIAAVGATAVGGFMLGKEAFSRMAGDKYEAGLMEQVEGNLTEKAKTDKGRDIAHTKGGYEESIRNLKLQNEELKQKGDPLSLRLIEKNNRLMESYRERADELYSEGATLKALESGRDIEDVKAENISTIERLEKELEDKNVEDKTAKEEQLKYEKLLQKGLEKEEVNRAAAEAARQEAEDKLKEESEEPEDVSEDVTKGITEGIEQSLPTVSEAVAVTAAQAATQPSLEDETGTSTPQSIERLTADSGAVLGTSVTAIAPVIGDTIPEESTAGLDDVITELPDTVSGNIRFLHREGDEPFYPAEPLQRGVPVEQRALPEYSEGQPVIQRYGVSGDVTQANTRLGMEGAPVEQRPLEIKGEGAPVYQRGYFGGITPFGAGINLGGIGGVIQQSGIMQGELGAIDATLGGGISGMLSGLGTKEGISRSVSGLVQGGLNIPVSDTLQAGVHGFLGGDRTVRSLGELGAIDATLGGGISGMLSGLGTKEGISRSVSGLVQGGLNIPVSDTLQAGVHGFLGGDRTVRSLGELGAIDATLGGGISGMLSGLGTKEGISRSVSGLVQGGLNIPVSDTLQAGVHGFLGGDRTVRSLGELGAIDATLGGGISGMLSGLGTKEGISRSVSGLVQGRLNIPVSDTLQAGVHGFLGGDRTARSLGELGAIDATLGGGISGMLSGLGTKEGISRSVSGLVQGRLNIPVSDTLQAGVHGFLGGDRTARSLGELGAIDATLGGGISGMLSGLGTKEGISRSVSGLVQGGLNIPVSDTLQAGVHGFLGGDRTARSLGELGKTAITSGDFGLGGYLQDTRAGQAVTVSGDLLGQVRSISQSMGNLPGLVTGKVKESISKGEIPSTTADLVRDNEQRNTEVLEKIARIGAGAGSMLGVGSTAGSGGSGGGSVSVQDTRMGMDDIGIMLVNMGYFS